MARNVGGFTDKTGPGAARIMRSIKRQEAEERNANTPHDRTKAHRLGRCECDSETAVRG